MKQRLSRRVSRLASSSTAAAGRAAQALAASGVDVVDFGLGEPDFATPDFVARAGISAIERGRTKYTDSAGHPRLRDAVAARYCRDGAACARDNVVVTAGAKQAVFNVCQALFEEGDEVALFSPYWVSFPEIVRLCGATPLFVPSEIGSGWKPFAERLAKAATPATRGVIVNSPNNPTGAVIEAGELEKILEWCASRDAYLIFDETYDRFLYDGRPQISAVAHWAAHSNRIVITGAASKTYAMTGWRLGWALARKELVSAMSAFQSHSTSNASTISQEAALVALTDLGRSDASVSRMLAEYARRRDVMLAGLAAIPRIECVAPEGAFYVFPRVAAYYGSKGVSGSVEFCEKLLAEAHVSAVAGEAFGEDSCVRFSFATSLERVEEGLRRLRTWLEPSLPTS